MNDGGGKILVVEEDLRPSVNKKRLRDSWKTMRIECKVIEQLLDLISQLLSLSEHFDGRHELPKIVLGNTRHHTWLARKVSIG